MAAGSCSYVVGGGNKGQRGRKQRSENRTVRTEDVDTLVALRVDVQRYCVVVPVINRADALCSASRSVYHMPDHSANEIAGTMGLEVPLPSAGGDDEAHRKELDSIS